MSLNLEEYKKFKAEFESELEHLIALKKQNFESYTGVVIKAIDLNFVDNKTLGEPNTSFLESVRISTNI